MIASAFQKELLFWVKSYSSKGYPLFPVATDKRPFVRWKEGATTDQRKLAQWWQEWPNAMIGMPTGSKSGIVVLDVDVKNDVNGLETLKDNGWLEEIPESTVEVETPSGGRHYYFEAPVNTEIRNSAGKIGPGLDVRGEGGFIILPPSRPNVHDNRDYRYSEGFTQEAGTLL